MKLLKFHGHSDDTFGEYGEFNEDHDNCANGTPIAFRVTAGGEALYVVGRYGENGCWEIGILLPAEGARLPMWPMMYVNEHAYSHALVIEVPDDVEVLFVPEIVK